ncbi:hypothetical protein [Arenimonas sp. MALMAid1274]|uniref:hypothetical protein n=1 Tax=Arenimonas sp. MALMAid1274 TaxID=3411630 RepID=UPI003B9EF973
MRPVLLTLTAAVVLALSACQPAGEPEATPPADVAPVAESAPAADAPAADAPMSTPSGDQYPAAQSACLDAVAAKAQVDRGELTVTEVLWAEAGVGVTLQVPGSEAPWSCLSDEAGNVQGAASTAGGDAAASTDAAGPTPAADGQTYPQAESGCLDAIAKVTNTDRAGLKVTEVKSAESGISVYIQVPGANGPWFCLANADGSVQGTEFRGDEGAL